MINSRLQLGESIEEKPRFSGGISLGLEPFRGISLGLEFFGGISLRLESSFFFLIKIKKIFLAALGLHCGT